MKKHWNFMIDQGGTFTDIISIAPDNEVIIKKVLSFKNDKKYHPVLNGIKTLMYSKKEFSEHPIKSIKIGTTIGTNALLERKGAPVLLCTTKGFKDNFIIGTQQRDHLFARHHIRKKKIYDNVIEVDERISHKGVVLHPLNKKKIISQLKAFYNKGNFSVAIAFINSFKYPEHEIILKSIAKDIGFTSISCSHEVSPNINFTKRGFTCLVDAYLNPIIENYADKVTASLHADEIGFMQSNGFLCEKKFFTGKSSVLSGPAGGVKAGMRIANINETKKLIGFDMGGTSTDVWHFSGNVEMKLETKISGVFIKNPSLLIDSIASGGGSIIKYENMRLIVGPESAGSYPGPACYRNNGPLTLTDCNLILGRIIEKHFPKYFGSKGNKTISKSLSLKNFKVLLQAVKKDYKTYNNVYQIAEAFIRIAVENMANAVKKITTQKGYDIRNYNLLIFGSASGQYACKVAEKLNIEKILFHPLSGLLSAYGVGISSYGNVFQTTVNKELNAKNLEDAKKIINKLAKKKLVLDKVSYEIRLKYFGSHTVVPLKLRKINIAMLKNNFFKSHKMTYGFNYDQKKIYIDSIAIEISGKKKYYRYREKIKPSTKNTSYSKLYEDGKYIDVKNIDRSYFINSKIIKGPVILNDYNTTIVVEKNWNIRLLSSGTYLISKRKFYNKKKINKIYLNPESLEIFNNLFFSCAEQMGIVLKNNHSKRLRYKKL